MSDCLIGEKHHPADIGYLCRGHLEKLGGILRQIEDEAVHLDARPSMAIRTGSGKGSLASERAPARLDVLVHTDRRRGTGKSETDDDAMAAGETLPILDVLGSWARIVREERGLAATEAATITGERRLLTTHLEWIAAQPWCDEFYADVRTLLGQLRRVNGTRPDRPYSYCPSIVAGEQCTGEVWIHDELQPVWRRYTDRCAQTWERAPGPAACDTCGAAWVTPADKARLRRMIDDAATELTRPRTEDGEPMRTAAEIADNLGVSVNAIRLRLSKAGIRAEHGGYYDSRLLVGQAS